MEVAALKKLSIWLTAGLFLGSGVFWGLSPVRAQTGAGQGIYSDKCAMCHGQDGKGNGPAAAALSPSPADFTSPAFWQNTSNAKITGTIENGHGPMPSIDVSPSQIKAVIDYMSQTFKPAG
jgi:mono/diheme cytochrome c family protein